MSKGTLPLNTTDFNVSFLLEQKHWGEKWGYLGENIT